MRPDLVQIVEDRGYGPAFAMPVPDELKEILAGSPINRGERLVEQDQLCILHDQPSKEDALELADGKRFDRPPFEPCETNGSKCFARRFAHRPVRGLGPADPLPMPKYHGIKHGNRKPFLDLSVLRHIGDPSAPESGPLDDALGRPHPPDDTF